MACILFIVPSSRNRQCAEACPDSLPSSDRRTQRRANLAGDRSVVGSRSSAHHVGLYTAGADGPLLQRNAGRHDRPNPGFDCLRYANGILEVDELSALGAEVNEAVL